MYKTLLPFRMGDEVLHRGTVINNDIEKCKNFHSLLKDGYILALNDKNGIPFVKDFYVAERSFRGGGKAYSVGDIVDLSKDQWRNVTSLIDSGYLRYATKTDVDSSTSHSPLSGAEVTPCLPPEQKKYKSEQWLIDRYVDNNATIPEMAKEANCSTSTIWAALKKAGIDTRPQGRHT